MTDRINTVKLRFERAKLPKSDFKLSATSTIQILKTSSKNDEAIGFQTQNLLSKDVEFGDPSGVLHEFKSKGIESFHIYKPDEPIWANQIWGEATDGDIWVPVSNHSRSLRIKVSSGNFHGYVDLKDMSEQNDVEKHVKDYDLHDKDGKKINGASLKLSYGFGIHYQIEFQVGDTAVATGSGGLAKYDIISHMSLNTKMTLHFQLHGATSSSRFYQCSNENLLKRIISKIFSSDETMKANIFTLHSIGEPLAMSVRVEGIFEKEVNWYLQRAVISIENTDFHVEFPSYQWIKQGRMKTICVANGMLPGKVYHKNVTNPNLDVLRKSEIQTARARYQWQKQPGMPSHLFGTTHGCRDLLPREEAFSLNLSLDFLKSEFDGIHLKAHHMHEMLHNTQFKHIEDYLSVFHQFGPLGVPIPQEAPKHWQEDTYFGWMYVAGTNPCHLTLIKEVPKQFASGQFHDIAGNIINLHEATLKGRLFYADYTGLEPLGLHTEGVVSPPAIGEGIKYSAPCTCLLYVDTDKKLRPIAIQLLPGGPVFTPKDTKWQWLYAKMVVRNADGQYHQMWDHWFNAHAISEVFSISINRAFSRAHPIYRLLINHMKYTVAINTNARHGLVSPGGLGQITTSIGYKMTELLVANYAKMDLNKLDFPSRIESRGFHKTKDGIDKGALDEFPYVDDGALVWDAIYDFVGEYLRLYYETNDDIMTDSELRDWIKELREEGHPLHKNTFPKVETIEELQKLVASIIWIASCHHSVVNFNQFNVFTFVPNAPLTLFRPIAKTKEVIDEDYILQSLVGITGLVRGVGLTWLISAYSRNEEYLISNPYVEIIGDKNAKKCVEKHHLRLKGIDQKIDEHNKKRIEKGYFAYLLLKPSKIPNSVAI